MCHKVQTSYLYFLKFYYVWKSLFDQSHQRCIMFVMICDMRQLVLWLGIVQLIGIYFNDDEKQQVIFSHQQNVSFIIIYKLGMQKKYLRQCMVTKIQNVNNVCGFFQSCPFFGMFSYQFYMCGFYAFKKAFSVYISDLSLGCIFRGSVFVNFFIVPYVFYCYLLTHFLAVFYQVQGQINNNFQLDAISLTLTVYLLIRLLILLSLFLLLCVYLYLHIVKIPQKLQCALTFKREKIILLIMYKIYLPDKIVNVFVFFFPIGKFNLSILLKI
eukprot:TRINITY_DN2818_c0_g1_i8.p4 TRINITY_DN2818_c0_g1~~TRINITY_DN2818_c0_g1_i8.p4  ORF type:complete len:270 (+),score=-29.00 TRINITY_DN2818_c0_g1_i8:377-1186(+)